MSLAPPRVDSRSSLKADVGFSSTPLAPKNTGATRWVQQLLALLKKNVKLKTRQPLGSLLEILLPLGIMIIMVIIRSVVSKSLKPDDLHLDKGRPFVEADQMEYLGGLFNSSSRFAQSGNRLIFNYRIAFVPGNDPTVRQIHDALLQEYPIFRGFTNLNFNTESDMESYCKDELYSKDDAHPGVYGAIIFYKIGSASNRKWEVRYRFNATDDSTMDQGMVDTTFIKAIDNLNLDYIGQDWNTYFDQGVSAMQAFVERRILFHSTGTAFNTTFSVQPFPTVAHYSDPFADYVSSFLGLIFVLAFIWPVIRLVGLLVEEKETRIKEGMKMMSLSESALYCSWLLTYAIVFIIMAALITAVTSGGVYELSDKGLIFLYFFLFGMSVFAFCYMLSSCFSRARVASTVAAVVFLISFFPYYAVSGSSSAGEQKGLACFLSPVCFGLGATIIQKLESAQQGITNNSTATGVDGFSYGAVIAFFIVDIIIYTLLGLYFERVIPSTYGVAKKWYFCCCCCCESDSRTTVRVDEDLDKIVQAKGKQSTTEPVPESQKARASVRIRHLRKEFTNPDQKTTFVAVDDFNMDLFEGQIFALLGHNGAGKSTMINMLSGMLPATSGDASVLGLSLSNQLANIRDYLGVCPQHDILFPTLTVREHLELYAHIKGMNLNDIAPAIEAMVHDVGLTEKIDTPSGVLSGGQKRKLSVGIALIGGSKLVFLDEPTSGMDPFSRRSTWELLRRGKQGRTIILTTHFMDEADELGDRIAIMAKGDVRCVGSSLFLKSRYGVGYTMTMSKAPNANEQALDKLIRSYVPTASFLSHVAGEVSYRLPFDASAAFPDMFTNLDRSMQSIGVNSYGISVTTLEEVFLRVASEGEHDDKKEEQKSPASEQKNAVDRERVSSIKKLADTTVYQESSVIRHFFAMMHKRWHNAKRDRKVWTWTIVYPFLIMLAGVGLLKLAQPQTGPSVDFSTADYNKPNYVAFNNNSLASQFPTSALNYNVFAGNSLPFPVNGLSDPVDMSYWLLRNYRNLTEQSRYGAYFYDQPTASSINAKIFINTSSSTHALPIFYNLHSNMLLQKLTNDVTASIVVSARPLPFTADQQSLQASLNSVFISIAFAFIPASWIAWIVKERETKAKHLQLISGVDIVGYWLSNYVWDLINYVIPACLMLVVLGIYNLENLLGEATGGTIMSLILYGLSVGPFVYAFSFLFTHHNTAQNTTLLICIFAGVKLLIVSIVMDIIPSTRTANKGLKYLYRILLPNYCFGESIVNIIVRKAAIASGGVKGVWDLEVTGLPMIFMTIQIFFYSALVFAIEKVLRSPEWLHKFIPVPQVEDAPFENDPDVIAEQQRLSSGEANNDTIRIEGLRKVYRGRLGTAPKVAVKNLWFGVHPGECFGFLGINGAGKTTTLQILSGDDVPTSGVAFLGGKNILTHQDEVRRMIGYCPQFDALIDTMTAREHLYLYARIKGIPESDVAQFAAQMIEQLGLAEYADRPSGGYSGGNKRKLSVGIALIGNPKIVFLDEPSTGMDPKSRRFMWDLISNTMAGRSVILTTHSMEECEALCGRIGIMVGGRLRCLGGAQHLKHRYGDGYQVDITTGRNPVRKAKNFLMERVPGAMVIEQHPSSIKIRVSRQSHSLAELFRMLEQNKQALDITDYSVSETTLEQIFIHFAKQQEEEQDKVAGLTDLDQEKKETVVEMN